MVSHWHVELDHSVYLCRILDGLASLALQRREYAAADALHRDVCRIQARTGIQPSSPLPHILRSYSAWKVGSVQEAQHQISAALRTTIERNDAVDAADVLCFWRR